MSFLLNGGSFTFVGEIKPTTKQHYPCLNLRYSVFALQAKLKIFMGGFSKSFTELNTGSGDMVDGIKASKERRVRTRLSSGIEDSGGGRGGDPRMGNDNAARPAGTMEETASMPLYKFPTATEFVPHRVLQQAMSVR